MVLYTREPLSWIDGIPVFTQSDEYSKNYEDIAQDHLQHLVEHGHSPFMTDSQIDVSHEATAELVHRYVRPGSTILDGGVGTGMLWKGMPGYEVHGVDVATEYLKIAKTNGIHAAKAQLADLPYADCAFDAVTVCDVLEHLIYLDASVRELHRVLKPDGYLIVRVPNNEDLTSYVSDKRYKYAHVRSFTAHSLELYMEKCFGFELIEIDYCARGFYTSTQLINPAVPRGSALHEILTRLQQELRHIGSRDAAVTRELTDAYGVLGKSLATSLEEQVDALITIRDRKDSGFAELASVMLHPAELLGVFRRQT